MYSWLKNVRYIFQNVHPAQLLPCNAECNYSVLLILSFCASIQDGCLLETLYHPYIILDYTQVEVTGYDTTALCKMKRQYENKITK